MKKRISKMSLSFAVLLAASYIFGQVLGSNGNVAPQQNSKEPSPPDEYEYLIFLYMNGVSNNQDLAEDAYILDSQGNVLHTWHNPDPDAFRAPEASPGYLTPDGMFLRGIESEGLDRRDFTVGVWGTLQLLDWDGNVVWEYDSFNRKDENGVDLPKVECFHHDVELLPNGNILATAFRLYTEEEAQSEFGWQPTGQGKVLTDIIYELKPNLQDGSTEIVWKWSWVDHVIQQHDTERDNYGEPEENPEKISIHYYDSINTRFPILNGTHSHINAIDYNPERDEILISSGTYDEIYIIDHSTTTEQAEGSTEGNRGKGGDILYRWGNPESYAYNGDETGAYTAWKWTNIQHDARWLLDGSGNITIHNNHSTTHTKPSYTAWSQALEIEVPYNPDGSYALTPNQPYGPEAPTVLAQFDSTVSLTEDPGTVLFASEFSGGAQKLPNGHIFSSSCSRFSLMEHDENGEVVWSFDLHNLHAPGGQVFKAQAYPKDYSGLSRLTENQAHSADTNADWSISQDEVNSFIASYNSNNNIATAGNGNITAGRITMREAMRVIYLYNDGGSYIYTGSGTDGYDIEVAQGEKPAPISETAKSVSVEGDGRLVALNTLDAGAGSLRDAIAIANDGETIAIDGSLDTIALLSEIVIDKSITIDGQGTAILSGDKMTRIFRIQNDERDIDVTLKNMGIADAKNAADEFGGAIYNNGQILTIETVLFDGNANTTEYGKGGAVYSSGTLSIENCVFRNNKASEEDDIYEE